MIPRPDPRGDPQAGADVGATLAKLALRGPDGRCRYRLAPSGDLAALARAIGEAEPTRVGLTGGGAPALAAHLPVGWERVAEFDAWGAGARAMLRERGMPDPERFLLVSLGTGTSIMRVEGDAVVRVGGTALGGGTVLGLGRMLAGSDDFDELARLARSGDRRRVDLLVRDIYRDAEQPIPGDVNAASFARLPRLPEDQGARPADLADALMGMVAENVALIASALAASHGVRTLVFGGSTLRDNPALSDVLGGLCRVLGLEPTFLPRGEYVGALGALELAES